MSALTITLTGVFGLDALSLNKTENAFHQWQEIFHQQDFAQDFSNAF